MHLKFRCFLLGYILILCICFQISPFIGATFKPLGNFCPNTPTYTPNTTYESNLKSLLPTLSSHANRQNGFYNFTAGDQEPVYGEFMCRGDVSAGDCGACVSDASATVLQICPNQTTATIWYDFCTLRYSDEPVYGIPNPSFVPFYLYNGNNDSRSDSFLGSVNKTLTQVADGVVNDRSPDRKFATQEGNFTELESIYSLAQCRPDIDNRDCQTCLRKAIKELQTCCYSRLSATALSLDCNMKYATEPFYNSTAAPPRAPPPISPPPPPTSSTSAGIKRNSSSELIIAIVVPVIGVTLFIAIFCLVRIKKEKKSKTTAQKKEDVSGISTEEFIQYDFVTIQAITQDFSHENKIGEGGYGPVYKGTLPNGLEVAIKRLSRNSTQGAQEFKNEVEVVAKLQHRNLVRLLGFCSEGEEKILIYEFVPNRSLDYFLFDVDKQYLLDWPRRYKIIRGIARGLLYLHEDSRLKIIHRDLKTGNILLDANMDPKIADFGLARIVEVDQIEGNTNRIVGTYGYMSPEYAMHGEFSVKSDIFSLGVIFLEIITGKKNRNISKGNRTVDLLGYAWEYWRDGTPLEILDPVLAESYNVNEVIECIHISLLCVQEVAIERPTMAEVMLMLSSNSSNRWPAPLEPAFYHGGRERILKKAKSEQFASVNEVSISELHPR